MLNQVNLSFMPTAHYTTPRDTTPRDNPRQENRVMCGGLQHDTTRQKSGLVVSDLTMLEICDKARFLSCRVASCRRPPHITRFSCRGLSRRVASCNVQWALHFPEWIIALLISNQCLAIDPKTCRQRPWFLSVVVRCNPSCETTPFVTEI